MAAALRGNYASNFLKLSLTFIKKEMGGGFWRAYSNLILEMEF